MNKPKVLIVGAEATPFAKTGGLADVIGALPRALIGQGVDVRVVLPKHGIIKQNYGSELKVIATMNISMGWRTLYLGIETLEKDGVTYYFIDNEYYFGDCIYKGGEAEAEQYAYFCRAVVEAIPYFNFVPDVIHVNEMCIRDRYNEEESDDFRGERFNDVRLHLNDEGRLIDLEINAALSDSKKVGMDTYVIRKDLLEYLVEDCMSRGKYNFVSDLLMNNLNRIKIMGYKHGGYVGRLHSVASYYKLNMDFLNTDIQKDLF